MELYIFTRSAKELRLDKVLEEQINGNKYLAKPVRIQFNVIGQMNCFPKNLTCR